MTYDLTYVHVLIVLALTSSLALGPAHALALVLAHDQTLTRHPVTRKAPKYNTDTHTTPTHHSVP